MEANVAGLDRLAAFREDFRERFSGALPTFAEHFAPEALQALTNMNQPMMLWHIDSDSPDLLATSREFDPEGQNYAAWRSTAKEAGCQLFPPDLYGIFNPFGHIDNPIRGERHGPVFLDSGEILARLMAKVGRGTFKEGKGWRLSDTWRTIIENKRGEVLKHGRFFLRIPLIEA